MCFFLCIVVILFNLEISDRLYIRVISFRSFGVFENIVNECCNFVVVIA